MYMALVVHCIPLLVADYQVKPAIPTHPDWAPDTLVHTDTSYMHLGICSKLEICFHSHSTRIDIFLGWIYAFAYLQGAIQVCSANLKVSTEQYSLLYLFHPSQSSVFKC